MTENIILNAALTYAENGLKVIPLRPYNSGGKGAGKAPCIDDWTNCATTDPEQIKKWWAQYPDANVGIRCGDTANGRFLTVIDLDMHDSKNGFKSLYEWQKENGVLPETLKAKTGRDGYHYYFWTDKPYTSRVDILGKGSGVDVRSKGAQAVAAPSIHQCGKRYEWADGFDISRIADGGEVLDKLLTERETRDNFSVLPQHIQPLPINGEITDRIVAKLGLDFGEGGRNDAIHRLASSLQARGYSDGAIIELCARANAERCTPPLPEKEVQTAVQSALKAIRKGVPRDVSAVGDFEQYAERLAAKLPFIIPHNEKGDKIWYSVNEPILARYMLEHDHFFFLNTGGEKPLGYWYENGVYKPLDTNGFKGKIKAHIAEFDESDKNLHSTRVYDETYKQLLIETPRVSPAELNAREDLINFQNGVLDLRTMQLYPHSPKLKSTVRIPCDWKESAQCPIFEGYIHTLTGGDQSVERLLLEYLGLIISNIAGYRPKAALFLVGKGDTGKSKYLELAAALVGSENLTAADLGNIEERFGTFPLWGKRLCGSGDMSFLNVRELKTFKKITGGDNIDFEQKGRDKFSGKFTGAFLFCCNAMPKFGGDKGDHVYKRMLVVHCDNVIPEERQDRRLIDKMLAEREGIVFKAVSALKAFTDRGFKFDVPASCRSALEEYKVENDTVLQFLDECTVPREQADCPLVTSTGQMYTAYKNYTAQSKLFCADRREFKRKIVELYGANAEQRTAKKTANAPSGTRFYPFELLLEWRNALLGATFE